MKYTSASSPTGHSRYVSPMEIHYSRNAPWKTLVRLLHGDYRRIAIGTVFTALKHIPALVLPVVVANVINILTDPAGHEIQELWWNVCVMSILILQNIPTYRIARIFLSRAIRNMEARIRMALVSRLQQLSMGFHNRYRAGRLHSKILVDVESLVALLRHVSDSVLMSCMNVVFACVLTVMRSRTVALFYLIIVPVAATLIHLFRGSMKKRNKEFRTQVESMSARVSEMVSMIPVTRAHGVEGFELRDMDTRFSFVKNEGLKLDLTTSLFASSAWVTFQFFQLVCLLVTGSMAWRGMIPIGDVVMYQGFFAMIVGSVNMLLNLYPELTRGFEALRSIGEVLECPDIEHNHGKAPVNTVSGAYCFDGISFVYPGASEPALQGINVSIQPGECLAVVGQSGAGKSTLLNLVIGFYRPTSGRVLLDGVDMQQLDLRHYRRRLAMVPQDTILFSGTIRDNITYGLRNISDKEVHEAVIAANAEDFIARLPHGLETIIGERGKTLSGGQRQRISIARAFIRKPDIIILDEATSSLDVASELFVQQAIERLIAGRTTFLVAHRLSTIRIADRVVVLRNGNIVESGTQDYLMSLHQEFFRLKSLQV